jgi:hypothetical protein
MLAWFKLNFPGSVKEAESLYGAGAQLLSTVDIDLNYQCAQVATTQDYLNRLFLSAFGRQPDPNTEVPKLVPNAQELSQPITPQRQAALAALITSDGYKQSFFNYGLHNFAQRVSGIAQINKYDSTAQAQSVGITSDVVKDIGEEFYQLLLKYVETTPYKNILLKNVVEVTANTAPLYDKDDHTASPCNKPASGWGECTLSAKRSNFFGTLAYLGSASSSYLLSNNNYKRGGNIFATLSGVLLMAQTAGPKGATADPMPSCLTTQDMRMVGDKGQPKAPRGAVAVPRSGATCQGCHLYKYLDVASYVFRPFDQYGVMFIASDIATDSKVSNYADDVTNATDASIVNVSDSSGQGDGTPVDTKFLQQLLAENTQNAEQCIGDHSGNKVASVNTIGDLTQFMIGDGSVLVSGLARYLPSVFNNASTTNQEIVAAVGGAYMQNSGLLLPVFQAYFNTQSFACAATNSP